MLLIMLITVNIIFIFYFFYYYFNDFNDSIHFIIKLVHEIMRKIMMFSYGFMNSDNVNNFLFFLSY